MSHALPLLIHETLGLARQGESLLGGVPLPMGWVRQGGAFTLRQPALATSTVLEGQAAAWWPDGSIRWLHLNGNADLAATTTHAFELLPGGELGPALTVTSGPEGISVRGGQLDLDLGSSAEILLRASRAGEAHLPLLQGPGLSLELGLCSPDGTARRTLTWKPAPEGPTIVTQGATRVVLRLGGRFVNSRGEQFGELILFVECLRDQPELRLQPVFIFLGKPETDLVASLQLRLHTRFQGPASEYVFANEQGRGFHDILQRIEGGPRWPEARQVQLGSTFYRTEKRVCEQASWTKALEGTQSQGWCYMGNDTGGVTAATRYFWEEYPRAHAVNCDTGELTFGLWPKEAQPLDLRRYSPIIYGQPVYEYKSPKAPTDEFPSEKGAPGIAKSHELYLRFHAPGERDYAERGLGFTNPCRLLSPGAQLQATGVLGDLAPPEATPLPAVEAKMTQLMDFIVNERHVRGWYGQMDFGDIMSAFYSDLDRWAFDDGGYAWINTEHIPDYGLWLSALRAARPDWLEAAIAMSRHNRDVDMYHRGPFHGHGTRHNVNHWGCADKEWRISMPLVRRLHYYLTADPWTSEVIRATVAMFQSYDRTTRIAPSMTSAVAGILVKWEMSGLPEDRLVVERIADVFAQAVNEQGQWRNAMHLNLATGEGEPVGDQVLESHFFMNGFGGQHTLVAMAELLQHEGLTAALVRHARWCLSQGKGIMPTLLFANFAARFWPRYQLMAPLPSP